MSTDAESIRKLWDLPWPVMDVLIGGRSSIDLPALQVESWDEATDFVRAYGYNPDSPACAETIHRVIIEAWSFVITRLIKASEWRRGVRPPDDLLRCNDVRKLLVWASDYDPGQHEYRIWSCAILRVMHTIVHLDGVTRTASLSMAREQIISRFHENIHRDQDGNLWLGQEPDCIKLVKVEWKYEKERDSAILKLLHKRDNVAETIYDLMGVRIVTERLCDTLLAVKFLRRYHLVTYPNCVPDRARNNLIDVSRFRQQLDALFDMFDAGSVEPEAFTEMMGRMTAPTSIANRSNPHSAATYRSIQLTCRQLIRGPNPQLSWLSKLKDSVNDSDLHPEAREHIHELLAWAKDWHALKEREETRAFFPFEVQILDAESYQATVSGEANHGRYKRSQLRAARRRVLFEVLSFHKKKGAA